MSKTFADFRAAFPHLYSDVRCGFSCPDGWLEIVWQLSEKLEPLGVTCDQVKEKFGGLRFYLRTAPDPATSLRAREIILQAEDQASRHCEICGSPEGKLGKWREHYIRTMCPEHTPKDVEQDVPKILTDPEGFASEFREAISKKAEP